MHALDSQNLLIGSEDGTLSVCYDPDCYLGRLNAAQQRGKFQGPSPAASPNVVDREM